MKLLNPLFDSVFKYIMEDIEVAKTLISAIIKKEIKELYPAPQEATGTKLKIKYAQLEIYRQDYVAIVKSKSEDGNEKYEKIVIEVQKSPFIPELGRFRNYLADKYRKKSSIPETENSTEVYLPIKTIYLVEEIFNKNLPAVLGRRGHYYDELENKEYKGEQDKVVELFAHDAWFIQTELLPPEFKDELMYILSVFAPSFRKNSSDRFIEIPDNDLLIKKHRILERIIRRLEAASQDTEIIAAVDIEIGYEDYILKNIKAKEEAELRADRERKQKEEAELKVRVFKLFVKGITKEVIAAQQNISIEMVNRILDE